MQCPACGAEIRTVDTPDGKVRIDARSELGKGPHRYVVEPEDRSRAVPVSESYAGDAHSDHRFSCEAR